MPKSHVRDFTGLYGAILADIAVYHPDLVRSLEKDFGRLKTLARTQGENVFLLHLPALGKRFDRALDEGVLQLAMIPLSGRINTRTPIPRLFQGMWLRIFSLDGRLRSNIDPNDIFFMQTLFYACKKFRKGCPPVALFRATKEYFDVDRSLPPQPSVWDGDGSEVHDTELGRFTDLAWYQSDITDPFRQGNQRDAEDLDKLQQVADVIAETIGDFVPGEHRFRHGPGAVSESGTGKHYKYAFPSWSERLQHVFPGEVFALANTSVLGYGYDLSDLMPLREEHSRLIAVPKTQKAPRLIAAEPTSHQWVQQSMLSFLKERIRLTFVGRSIDFGRQDLSGELALAASYTRSHGTIDLSSASDRLSCYVVQRFFRRNKPLLSGMIACRTRYLRNDIDRKMPSVVKLRKFASMGSALTFPIQSIVFYGVCIAAGHLYTDQKVSARSVARLSRQVRVYGDDLIVPVSWMPLVEGLLTKLHLKVNRDKTFGEGNFRESCGTVAYQGHDVAAGQVLEFYEQSRPSTVVSVVAVSNNLFRKGLWHAADYMTKSLPVPVRRLIMTVGNDAGTFGLTSFVGPTFNGKRRWNHDLQREEALTFRAVARKPKAARHESFANLLQFFTEDPTLSDLSDWESGVFAKNQWQLAKGWVAV